MEDEFLPSDELIHDVLNDLDNTTIDLDSSTPSSSASTPPVAVRYFREDPLIPIYSIKERPVNSKSIAQEIVDGVETHLVSSLVPHQPSENVSFMVGTQYLGHWKDVLADNLGTWRCDGTKTLYYATETHSSSSTKLQPSSEEKSNLRVTRYLYAYPQTTSFKRIVITVHDKLPEQNYSCKPTSVQSKWQLKSPIFLQYYFTDGRKPIFVSPHGNSKKLKPYFRTKESVKTKIKSKLPEQNYSCKPKTVLSDMIKETGNFQFSILISQFSYILIY